MIGPHRSLAGVPTLVILALVSSCGVPGGGSVRRVDDGEVPYRLLESGSPSPTPVGDGAVSGRTPVLVWLVDEGRLVTEPTSERCSQSPEPVVERLLAGLTAGPSEEARADGWSTAIPPESRLVLSGLSRGRAEIDIETASAISADRLPGAVGQIVLSVTSVAGVDSVVLVSDGAPVQVPLPGGALSAGAVTDQDYIALLPDRLKEPGTVGCARP